MGRNPRTKVATLTAVQRVPQDSHLLKLPPELRNMIYELVSKDVDKVVLAHSPRQVDIMDMMHPLSRTCHQIRREFAPIYLANSATHAREFVCHVRNLDSRYEDVITWYLKALPPLPDGNRRMLTQKVFLDNTFDRYVSVGNPPLLLPGRSSLLDGPSARWETRFYVDFDSRSFDVDYLREFTNKRLSPIMRASGRLLWDAVAEAIERHEVRKEAEAKARAKKRRRVRQTAKTSRALLRPATRSLEEK